MISRVAHLRPIVTLLGRTAATLCQIIQPIRDAVPLVFRPPWRIIPSAGADFSHQGALITFEVMARDFDLSHPAIIKMAELVHFIDVQEDAVLPDDAALLKTLSMAWVPFQAAITSC